MKQPILSSEKTTKNRPALSRTFKLTSRTRDLYGSNFGWRSKLINNTLFTKHCPVWPCSKRRQRERAAGERDDQKSIFSTHGFNVLTCMWPESFGFLGRVNRYLFSRFNLFGWNLDHNKYFFDNLNLFLKRLWSYILGVQIIFSVNIIIFWKKSSTTFFFSITIYLI